MILVVYSHAESFLLPPPISLTKINEIFILFRMPLFFFISGLFAYSEKYCYELLRRRSINRLVRQLYPTVLLWGLFCIVFETRPVVRWPFDTFKSGYWFTLVAVEYFFVLAPLLFFFHKYSCSKRTRTFGLLLMCVVVEGIYLLTRASIMASDSPGLFSLLSLWHFFKYFAFFVFGMIVKIYSENFRRFCSNAYAYAGSAVVFAVAAIAGSCVPSAIVRFSCDIICGFTGILTVYMTFMRIGAVARGPMASKVMEKLSVVGRSTLEIYLLHYFVIFTLRAHIDFGALESLRNSVWEFPVFFVISTAIAVICLLIVGLLKGLRLYGVMFPSIRSNGPVPVVSKAGEASGS